MKKIINQIEGSVGYITQCYVPIPTRELTEYSSIDQLLGQLS